MSMFPVDVLIGCMMESSVDNDDLLILVILLILKTVVMRMC